MIRIPEILLDCKRSWGRKPAKSLPPLPSAVPTVESSSSWSQTPQAQSLTGSREHTDLSRDDIVKIKDAQKTRKNTNGNFGHYLKKKKAIPANYNWGIRARFKRNTLNFWFFFMLVFLSQCADFKILYSSWNSTLNVDADILQSLRSTDFHAECHCITMNNPEIYVSSLELHIF